MLDADAAKWQEAFARQVVTLIPGHLQRQEENSARLSFAWRLNVYHESFIGRTISALVDAVLEPAVNVFGGDCVKEVTARFFADNPPSATSIEKTLIGLPKFIIQSAEGTLALTLASLIEASIVWWDLLVGVDGIDRPTSNGLAGPSALIKAAGTFDL